MRVSRPQFVFGIYLITLGLCWFPPSILSQKPSLATALSSAGQPAGFVGDLACRPCHREKFDAYVTTTHSRTSRLPSADSIAGSFIEGHNAMSTVNPQLSFRMEARGGRYYETAVRKTHGRVVKRTEQIDFVIGSATKGQTYLYWKGDGLFELPVSYWTELDRWVNSPGYVDGSADFDRPVPPRCLECHAAYVQPVSYSPSENHYYKDSFVLGISCERCHGPGLAHVQMKSAQAAHLIGNEPVPPIGLSRDRQIDVCGQCHSGAGEPELPAFSFRPGDALSAYIKVQAPGATDRLDVHGNQVSLLERSRCFQSSPELSCSSCHDVHTRERVAADYSVKCLECHRRDECAMVRKLGPQKASNCIDCHMPVQSSNRLVLDADESRFRAKVRNHWIRVYENQSVPR